VMCGVVLASQPTYLEERRVGITPADVEANSAGFLGLMRRFDTSLSCIPPGKLENAPSGATGDFTWGADPKTIRPWKITPQEAEIWPGYLISLKDGWFYHLSLGANVDECGKHNLIVYYGQVQPCGQTGPSGPAGPQGPPGPCGATGATGPKGDAGECTSFAQLTPAPCPPKPEVRIIERVVTRTEYYPDIGPNGGFCNAPVQGGGQIAVIPPQRGFVFDLIGAAAGVASLWQHPGDFIVTATANGGYATGGQGGEGGSGYGYGAAAAAASSSSSSTSAVPGAAAGTSGSGGSSAGAP